jgi:hypothetical protein
MSEMTETCKDDIKKPLKRPQKTNNAQSIKIQDIPFSVQRSHKQRRHVNLFRKPERRHAIFFRTDFVEETQPNNHVQRRTC